MEPYFTVVSIFRIRSGNHARYTQIFETFFLDIPFPFDGSSRIPGIFGWIFRILEIQVFWFSGNFPRKFHFRSQIFKIFELRLLGIHFRKWAGGGGGGPYNAPSKFTSSNGGQSFHVCGHVFAPLGDFRLEYKLSTRLSKSATFPTQDHHLAHVSLFARLNIIACYAGYTRMQTMEEKTLEVRREICSWGLHARHSLGWWFSIWIFILPNCCALQLKE